MAVGWERKMIFTKVSPWYMAQYRIAVVNFVTLPMAVSTEFWKTWGEVYRSRF
jgi:hypothetical protein